MTSVGIKSSIEELAPQIAERDITMAFAYDSSEATVRGHEASLVAMFRNLIENAVRYVDVRGAVEITLSSTDDAVQVDVCDDGPGIPADRRELVFTRFHRDIVGTRSLRQAVLLSASPRPRARTPRRRGCPNSQTTIRSR